MQPRTTMRAFAVGLVLSVWGAVPAVYAANQPVFIGLDADMTGGDAQGGEAIHRGVAVIGGVHTPVAMEELESIHRHKLIYLGPWAAGTPVVANGYKPNYVFRVSVRDEHAGNFLIRTAREQGFERPGLLLWRTGWGRSNEKAMTAAMNATDGQIAIRDIARMPAADRLPVVSHWGITGGDFFNRASADIGNVKLSFLQTFSFFAPPFPDRAKRVYEGYCKLFGPCKTRADVLSPVGVDRPRQSARRAGDPAVSPGFDAELQSSVYGRPARCARCPGFPFEPV